MRQALWMVWVGGLGLCLASACHDDASAPHGASVAGQAPSTSGGESVGGGGAATSGLGDAGLGGGEGGRLGAIADAVRAAAEAGLSEEEVELDVNNLAGHSFTLLSSLCPTEREHYTDSSGSAGASWDGDSLTTVHVRRGAAGGLEAVTYTEDGGEPQVQITPMRQVGLGWELEGVMTCAYLEYIFEETYETERYRSPRVHVVFRREGATSDLNAVVAAIADEQVLVSEAALDASPPGVYQIKLHRRYIVDLFRNQGFSSHFMFTEPVPLDTVVQIKRESGATAEIKPYIQEGYLVGFSVSDLLSSDFQLAIELRDLAGNDVNYSQPYPGVSIAPIDGSFEVGDGENYLDSREWDADSTTSCDTGAGESVDPGVAALAGTSSFLVGGDDNCVAWLRFTAQTSDTKLSFDARLVGDLEAPAKVCVSSLGVGGDGVCSTFETGWTAAGNFPGTKTPVSNIRSLTVDLPSGATDLLIELQAGRPRSRLWIDSMHSAPGE